MGSAIPKPKLKLTLLMMAVIYVKENEEVEKTKIVRTGVLAEIYISNFIMILTEKNYQILTVS